MKNVYLMDYHQFTRLSLTHPPIDVSKFRLPKLRNIMQQQGGLFFEMQDSKTLERIATNEFNGYIYKYATNKISTETFINGMCEFFNLTSQAFTKYWETILKIDNLPLIALNELAKLQERSECIIHISGNLTKLNAEWLNTQLALAGLKDLQFTCSYLEEKLVDQDYVTKAVNSKYPTTDYNLIDLRTNTILTPDLFRENPSNTIAPRSTVKLTP